MTNPAKMQEQQKSVKRKSGLDILAGENSVKHGGIFHWGVFAGMC